jgi:hypothetical protein
MWRRKVIVIVGAPDYFRYINKKIKLGNDYTVKYALAIAVHWWYFPTAVSSRRTRIDSRGFRGLAQANM